MTEDLHGVLSRLIRRYYSRKSLAPYSDDQLRAAASEVCTHELFTNHRVGNAHEFSPRQLIDLVERTYRRLLTLDAVGAAAQDPKSGIFLLPGVDPETGLRCTLVHCLTEPLEYLDLITSLRCDGNLAGAEHVLQFGLKRFGRAWPRRADRG